MAKAPLSFVFYIAAPIEKVWNGFVSKEANRTIFMGADFDVDLKPGGAMSWSGPGKDGKPTRYVTGKVLRVEAPNLLEFKFAMGEGHQSDTISPVTYITPRPVSRPATASGWSRRPAPSRMPGAICTMTWAIAPAPTPNMSAARLGL